MLYTYVTYEEVLNSRECTVVMRLLQTYISFEEVLNSRELTVFMLLLCTYISIKYLIYGKINLFFIVREGLP